MINLKDATITVEENRLILSKECIDAINAKAGDRISINFWTVNSEETYPIIGKSEIFTDGLDGNRLTKSNSVSYRGEQNMILRAYGSSFYLEEIKDKPFYRLVSFQTEEDPLLEELEALNKLEDKEIIF